MSDHNFDDEFDFKFDDDLLERAAHAVSGQTIDELSALPEHVFSTEFEQKMQRLIRQQKRPDRMKKLARFSRRAAVFMVAGFVGISACVLSVNAWRTKLFKMVEQKNPEYSEITYKPIEGADAPDLSDYSLVEYRPAYVPDGFRLTEQMLGGVNWCEYTTATGSSFSFNQSVLGRGSSSINTEGCELTPFMLGDNDAFKMTNRGAHFVLWSDERYEFSIVVNDTDMTLDEAIKIAQSVTVSPIGAPHPPQLALSLGERPIDYPIEDAIKNGDVTVQGGVIQNLDRLDAFFADMAQGKPTIICVADYDQPKMMTHEIYFDGFRVSIETDTTRRDGDETNHFSEGRNYTALIRETQNGETVIYGANDGAENSVLLRYKDAEQPTG